MTILIGYEHDGEAYIGCDSSLSSQHTIHVERDTKLFRRGELLIATTSTGTRFKQLLKYMMPGLDEQRDTQSDYEYIVRVVVEAIRDTMNKYGMACTGSDGDEIMNGVCLIGYRGKIYRIWDYQVDSHASGLMCAGSGQEFAYGAIRALVNNPRLEVAGPEVMILDALKIVAEFGTGVCGPFFVEKV